jgi:hypothetical protein
MKNRRKQAIFQLRSAAGRANFVGVNHFLFASFSFASQK